MVEENTTFSASLEARMAGSGEDFIYSTLLDNEGEFTITPNLQYFYGTVHDTEGDSIEGVNVSVDVYDVSEDFEYISTFSTLSDANGDFNLSLPQYGKTYLYGPELFKDNGTDIYVSKPLPELFESEFMQLSPIDFYLKEGAKLNITVVNESGLVPFNYQIKDTRLGYPITENFEEQVTQASVYLPIGRDYAVMAFPEMAFPSSLPVENLTANEIRDVEFNNTEELITVSGYAAVEGDANFSDFHVIPLLLEAGNNVFLEYSTLPANMSAWQWPPAADTFNNNTGFYNITLPAVPAPGIDMVLMYWATRNGGEDEYAFFKKITNVYGDPDKEFNVSLYELAGEADRVLTQDNEGGEKNTNVLAVNFSMRNDTGDIVQENVFVEAELDYSGLGGPVMTFSEDIGQEDLGSFQLPILLNEDVDVKINVFSSQYAPRKNKITYAQLDSGETINITLGRFDPGAIDEGAFEDVFIDMIKSTEACNVPNYNAAECSLFGGSKNITDFNPISAVMGGTDLTFVMGRISTGVLVMYKNADLLASGPPDVVFDGEGDQNEEGSTLEEIWRFGSKGPEIYDEILIGIPLNPDADQETLSIFLGKLYDEEWNTLWNIENDALGDIPEEYSDFNQTMFSEDGMPCSTKDTTAMCYIDSDNGMVWLTIPHFSGVGPTIEWGGEEGGTMYRPIVAPSKSTYEERIGQMTEGLTLQIKNRVKNTCNQMKNIIEKAREGSVTTNTSQFQEQMKHMGLENVEAVMTNTMEEEDITPNGLSEKIREEIKEKIGDKEFKELGNIKRDVKVTTFINKDGTSISLIEISYEVQVGDYVIEIPKSVAASAEEIQGNFDVLVNDPVLMFSNTDSIEFAVESNTNEVEGKLNESIAVSKAEAIEEKETEPEPTPPEEEEGEEEAEPEPPTPIPPKDEEEEKGSLVWLWILLIATVIAIVLTIIHRKAKKS
jgi:hypothetical protein